jgi:hypothetical protein
MSTEYEIWCGEHSERWPDGGVYAFNRPALSVILANRSAFTFFAGHGDFRVDLTGAYCDDDLCEWVQRHLGCILVVRDEYGRVVER